MAPDEAFDWRPLLEGTDSRYRRYRMLFRHIPRAPRCKMCAAPFEGPGAPFMRAIGRGRWTKNPNYCRICETWLAGHHGGAEIELSSLFADVRGSTGLAEHMTPLEFSVLLNRFYDVAARIVIDHEGLVDKFVGDEVVAMFTPGFSGERHASRAIAAGRALLDATGHGQPDGPWIPVGIGVHSGRAFVGSIGEGGVTDFTALGDTVNAAARLSSAAAGGEVLVSRAALTAAGMSDEGLEQRHLELRGRTEPLDVVVIRAS